MAESVEVPLLKLPIAEPLVAVFSLTLPMLAWLPGAACDASSTKLLVSLTTRPLRAVPVAPSSTIARRPCAPSASATLGVKLQLLPLTTALPSFNAPS